MRSDNGDDLSSVLSDTNNSSSGEDMQDVEEEGDAKMPANKKEVPTTDGVSSNTSPSSRAERARLRAERISRPNEEDELDFGGGSDNCKFVRLVCTTKY